MIALLMRIIKNIDYIMKMLEQVASAFLILFWLFTENQGFGRYYCYIVFL